MSITRHPYTGAGGTGLLENLFGAFFIAFALIARPFLKNWMYTWGATPAETQRALPGDARVPRPKVRTTRAITIHAPAEAVWSWVAQVGQERGGLYSYQRLENLGGCQIRNANQIVPEWQDWQPGDVMRLGPKGYPLFKLVEIEPGRTLVFAGADPKTEVAGEWRDPMPPTYVVSSWTIMLEPVDARTTRLIMREQVDYAPANFANWLVWVALAYTIDFVMMRKMLLGIRARAEATV